MKHGVEVLARTGLPLFALPARAAQRDILQTLHATYLTQLTNAIAQRSLEY